MKRFLSYFERILYHAGKQAESPFCPSCPDVNDESIDHVLLECSQKHQARQQLRAALTASDVPRLFDAINRAQAIDAITGELSVGRAG